MVSWSVETTDPCGEQGWRTIDEARRACAAARTCTIGAPEEAERRALLTCTRDEMIVDASAADGRRLWSLTVTGSATDRARQAAVWIARSDEDVVPPSPPPAPPSAPPPRPSPANEGAPKAPIRPKQGGLALGLGYGGFLRTPQDPLVPTTNLELAAALHVGFGALGPVMSVQRTELGLGPEARTATLVHAGLRWHGGAPWTHDVFGIGGELGTTIPVRTVGEPSLEVTSIFVAQYPHGDMRPYAALTVRTMIALDDDIRLGFAAIAGAGVAWSAW